MTKPIELPSRVTELVDFVGSRVNPPDARPVDAVEWQAVESRLGFKFPLDYKALIASFGSAAWADFLHVLNPLSPNPNLNEVAALRTLGAAHEVRRAYPDDVPFALFPEHEGLFPWGLTDNGDTLYWLAQGPAALWPTVIFESRGPQRERHDLSVSALLLAFVAGSLSSHILMDPFDGQPPRHRW